MIVQNTFTVFNRLLQQDIEKFALQLKKQPELLNATMDYKGEQVSLLELAVSRNNYPAVKLLCNQGADPTHQPKNLINTLLFHGQYHPNPPSIELLQLLIDLGVTFPTFDEESYTSFILEVFKKYY